MTETASGPGSLASAGAFVGTFALIFAAIAGLFAIDTFLADRDHAASRAEARRLYEEGERLQAKGDLPVAVERLRGAVSAERMNPAYQRGLAAALIAAGRTADAQTVLSERLQHDPTDAESSLMMARTLARQGQTRQAIAFYHRAIFGDWDEPRRAHRVGARFELVALLAAQHGGEELLAELLPLETEAPDDPATRSRIARLFLAAGSPARAITIFRDLARRDPRDADAFEGLGEAELQQGDYRSARPAFAAAHELRPGDRNISDRLELCDRALALDPAKRGVGAAERYRRSNELLKLTVAAVDSCATLGLTAPAPALLDSAKDVLTRPVAAASSPEEGTEAQVNLAERVWRMRPAACSVPPWARPAELVLAKLAD
jgi:tetratricopeptide (TPR) repeat protein